MSKYRLITSERSGIFRSACWFAHYGRSPISLCVSSLAVFDVSALERLATSNPAVLSTLVRMITDVREQLPVEMALARLLAFQGEWQASANCLHRLRGICGVVGAKSLARTALSVEVLLQNITPVGLRRSFFELDRQVSTTLNHAEGWLLDKRYEDFSGETTYIRR